MLPGFGDFPKPLEFIDSRGTLPGAQAPRPAQPARYADNNMNHFHPLLPGQAFGEELEEEIEQAADGAGPPADGAGVPIIPPPVAPPAIPPPLPPGPLVPGGTRTSTGEHRTRPKHNAEAARRVHDAVHTRSMTRAYWRNSIA